MKYDKDGNMVYGPLNGVMTNFTYDCRNRLIQAGTTKYEYDAEDNRIAVIRNAETANEVRTEYVVDSVEELSRTLMATEIKAGSGEATANDDTNPEGTTTYFYYGNGLLAQENAQEGYLTYHFNNVGSTNAVTDENGKIKYSYDYNPYGELTKGSYGQVMFLFNGQYGVVSDDNGLYYMRARYYNVFIKRFINQDIVTGKLAESQSLNRYAYVEGNPVSYLDPFGLEPLLTDDLHSFATFLSLLATIVSQFWKTGGIVLETAALAFDAGLYINDIIASNFDKEVIQNAVNAMLTNAGFYTMSALSFGTTIIPELFYAMMDGVSLTLALGDLVNNYIDVIYRWMKENGVL